MLGKLRVRTNTPPSAKAAGRENQAIAGAMLVHHAGWPITSRF